MKIQIILFCFSVTVATSTAPVATCWWTSRSQIQTCSSSEPWNPSNFWDFIQPKNCEISNPGGIYSVSFELLQSWNLEIYKANQINPAPGTQRSVANQWFGHQEHFECQSHITSSGWTSPIEPLQDWLKLPSTFLFQSFLMRIHWASA